jgi:hypothetical protein
MPFMIEKVENFPGLYNEGVIPEVGEDCDYCDYIEGVNKIS